MRWKESTLRKQMRRVGSGGYAALLLASACLLVLPARSIAQKDAAIGGLPLRVPGYELYYHNEQSSDAFATRWGYYDGWTDGRHNRELGQKLKATDEDHYKLAPDHGQHPGLTRDRYKSSYRTAYLHGYEQGSKR